MRLQRRYEKYRHTGFYYLWERGGKMENIGKAARVGGMYTIVNGLHYERQGDLPLGHGIVQAVRKPLKHKAHGVRLLSCGR